MCLQNTVAIATLGRATTTSYVKGIDFHSRSSRWGPRMSKEKPWSPRRWGKVKAAVSRMMGLRQFKRRSGVSRATPFSWDQSFWLHCDRSPFLFIGRGKKISVDPLFQSTFLTPSLCTDGSADRMTPCHITSMGRQVV